MPIVNEVLDLPGSGSPTVTVTIELVGSGGYPVEGFHSAGNTTIVGKLTPTVTAGAWSATLIANDLIVPAGTAYKRTVKGRGFGATDFFEVPNTAGPFVLEDILTEAPASIATSTYSALAGRVTVLEDAPGGGGTAATTTFDPTGNTIAVGDDVQEALDQLDANQAAAPGTYALASALATEVTNRGNGDTAAIATAASDATTKANAAQAAAIAAAATDATTKANAAQAAAISAAATDATSKVGVETAARVADVDAEETRALAAEALLVAKSLYDANTVLAATADNTPLPITMAASTILARLASGDIKAATPSELRTLLALVIGTNVQAWDADLDAIAALTTTTIGRSLLAAADAAAIRTITGAVSDTAYDATSWNGVTDIAPSKNAVRDKIEALGSGTLATPGIGTPSGGSLTWQPCPDYTSYSTANSSGLSANVLYYEVFRLVSSITVSALGWEVTVTGTGAVRAGIVSLNSSFQPVALMVDAGSVADTSTGIKSITGLSTALTAGLYARVFIADSTLSLRRWEGGVHPGMLASSPNFANPTRLIWAASASAQFTALSNPTPAWTNTDGGSAPFQHIFMKWS